MRRRFSILKEVPVFGPESQSQHGQHFHDLHQQHENSAEILVNPLPRVGFQRGANQIQKRVEIEKKTDYWNSKYLKPLWFFFRHVCIPKPIRPGRESEIEIHDPPLVDWMTVGGSAGTSLRWKGFDSDVRLMNPNDDIFAEERTHFASEFGQLLQENIHSPNEVIYIPYHWVARPTILSWEEEGLESVHFQVL